MAHNQLPQDSMERMLEQGAGQDPQNNPLAQMKAGAGGNVQINPFKAAATLTDPDAWIRELYGVSQPLSETSAEHREGENSNHTPLDPKKVGSKEQITPQHRQFFKKYQEEYEQFLDQKKKQEQDKKKQEEEEERKKKEEAKKRQEEEQNKDSGGQGKQKQKLGQPRRKATTEQHPETKAGGAK